MRRIIIVLMVAGLAVAFGAGPGLAAGGNLKRFCKTYLSINKAFFAEEPNLEKINRLLDTAVDTAPPEVADAITAAATAIQADPEGAFEDPAVGEAVGEVDSFAAENCADEQIDVGLEEYAFTGLPDEIDAGVVAFNLTNEGAELHEFHLVRLKGDATAEDLVDAEGHEVDEMAVTVAEGFAAPDESSTVVASLKKTGTYAALCFIPAGSTDEASAEAAEEAGAPPHAAEGMTAEFEVVR